MRNSPRQLLRRLPWKAIAPTLGGLLLVVEGALAEAGRPAITVVETARRPGTCWVDVAYDLTGPADQEQIVVLEASADGGRSYEVPVVHVQGDVGRVRPGRYKALLWDAGADAPELFAGPWAVRVRSFLGVLPDTLTGEMVRVPAGPVTMGSEQGDPQERPVHEVLLDAYRLDRFEVTNRAFSLFVQTTGHRTIAEEEGRSTVYEDGGYLTVSGASWRAPHGGPEDLSRILDHPVVQMSWRDARAFCAWAGKRLPSEAEWEKAARGTDRRLYPWGDAPPTSAGSWRANLGTEDCCHESDRDGFLNTAPVGSFPAGVSPYGIHDLAGNVWEWTEDWYGPTYYAESPRRNPKGPSLGQERVLRGGSWISYLFMLRTSYRGKHTEDTRHNYGGFRCARDD